MFPKNLAVTLLVGLLYGVPASAQDTRTELLERERAEKAKQIAAYQPSKVERGLVWFERTNPLIKIAPYNGFYAQYGYSEKPIGSGIAIGGGWRHDLFDRNARAVVEAGQSLRGYSYVRGDFAATRLLDERLELGGTATYRKEPQEDFYGLGIDSSKSDRTDFLFRGTDVQGRAVFKPRRWLNAGVRFGRIGVTVKDGTDKRFPDLSERFSDLSAPGFSAQPDFLYQDVFLTLDGRDHPVGPRSGAYYNVSWRRYTDNDLERYSFDRVDADLQHFIPFFHKKRVIATRVRLLSTTAIDDDVPFYFQPTLGGSESLRSTSDFRFRDRNLLAMNLEYRFEAFPGMDMALFTDQGTVASRFNDLDLGQLKGAYGLGFRFNVLQAVWLRIDVAGGGSDGIHTFFKFSGIF